MQIDFHEHAMGEGKLILDKTSGGSTGKHTLGGSTVRQVYCFPFYSMMLALNRTHIDYFSLDVEGLELDILKMIPFDKLDISVLSVEYVHGKDGNKAYEQFMEKQGYYTHSKIVAWKPEIYFGCSDYIFVKKGSSYDK